MHHSDIINYLIKKYNYKSYLEIGTSLGDNFLRIQLANKECNDVVLLDIAYIDNITYLMPSDEMFARMPVDKKYDIIFIDGMHDQEYVDRDIINSLKHLNPGGLVCVHDTLVRKADAQVTYENVIHEMEWNGDVWKSITKLQENNLEFYTIMNHDWGLTIIKYKDNPYALQVPQKHSSIRYDYVFNNTNDFGTCITEQGKYVLHIISEDDFLKIF